MSFSKWSTARIESLMASLNKSGVLPRDNPFFQRDVNYLKANLNFSYTQEEFLELAKSKANIIYFSQKYAKVMTDDGVVYVKLRDYQKRILNQFVHYRNHILLSSRQSGKILFSLSVNEYETIINNKKYHLEIPIFELYYNIKQNRNIFDKTKVILYRLLCWSEGIHYDFENKKSS